MSGDRPPPAKLPDCKLLARHTRPAPMLRGKIRLRGERPTPRCALQQCGSPHCLLLGRFLPKLGGASWHRHLSVRPGGFLP
jgi:hypothetical protein